MRKDAIERAVEMGEVTELTSIMKVKNFFDMAVKASPCVLARDYAVASKDGKYGFSISASESDKAPYVKIVIGPAKGELYYYEENDYKTLWNQLMIASRITGQSRTRIEQYILSIR